MKFIKIHSLTNTLATRANNTCRPFMDMHYQKRIPVAIYYYFITGKQLNLLAICFAWPYNHSVVHKL